tara:strand:+ start:6336 stop:6512 length:177 start_codon:yes stop_codon:yes gene_type:complete
LRRLLNSFKKNERLWIWIFCLLVFFFALLKAFYFNRTDKTERELRDKIKIAPAIEKQN